MAKESIQNKYTKVKSYTKPTESASPKANNTSSNSGRKLNPLAVAGLVLSLVGFFLSSVLSIVGIVLSSVALSQVKKDEKVWNENTKAISICGIVFGCISAVFFIVAFASYLM